MYILNLPLPPSLNNYYGHYCQGKRAMVYIKTRGKEYRKLVLAYVMENNLQLRANIPLQLSIHITPSSHHRTDIDNYLKCLLDALTEAEVWDDDSLVYKIVAEKLPPTKQGGILMEIAQYEP